MNIILSDSTVEKILKLEATENGRNWNYTMIEDRVNCMRYRVYDIVMTEILIQIEEMRGNPKLI